MTLLTSSSRLGKIFVLLSRSLNDGNTLTSPRRYVAFSSLGFEANVVGSRKFSVDIAREEKNGCDGKEARLRRDEGCLVSRRGSRSTRQLANASETWTAHDSVPFSSALHLSQRGPLAQSRLPSPST